MAYQFDHQWENERARLTALEAVFDPYSRGAVLATGPEPGWRCLDVGAGGGSVAAWLCGVVEPYGVVVATDIETKFLEATQCPNLMVREHNIVTDPLERGEFDLVHSRAVLAHLPERDQVLERLIDALKPGGWLVLVGADLSTVRAVGLPPDETRFFEVPLRRDDRREPFHRVRPDLRPPPRRCLPGGRTHAGGERGCLIDWSARHPLAQLYALTFQRLRARALDQGAITAEEHDRLLDMMADPRFLGLSQTIFAARGRKVPRLI